MELDQIDPREIQWHTLQAEYQQEMRAYIMDGVRPGPFIEAVLDDNLQDALEMITLYDYQAEWAFDQMRKIGGWLAGQAPLKCFGNVSKVEAWIARNGINGTAAKVRADVIKAQQIRARNEQMIRDRMTDIGGVRNYGIFANVIDGLFGGRKSS